MTGEAARSKQSTMNLAMGMILPSPSRTLIWPMSCIRAATNTTSSTVNSTRPFSGIRLRPAMENTPSSSKNGGSPKDTTPTDPKSTFCRATPRGASVVR